MVLFVKVLSRSVLFSTLNAVLTYQSHVGAYGKLNILFVTRA